jgi:thioredoxin reductase (NADPH)
VAASDAQTLEETPDLYGAFPRLTDAQIEALQARGARRRTEQGEVLYRSGDATCDFFVILDGKVAVVEGEDSGEQPIAVHGPGRFLGELGLLTGQAVLLTAVVVEPGEVLVVPVERLREVVGQDTQLGDLILKSLLIRRTLLIGLGSGLRIIGSRYSADTRRLREFAARNRIPHRWIDLERDPGAEALLRDLGISPEETPVVIWRAETVLRNPTNAELAEALGLRGAPRPEELADLVVVGAGPAGLAASVYGASEGLGTVALDAVATGGQAATSSRIENYLGFPAGISGAELAERATIQAEKFGARISVPGEAIAIERRDGHYEISLAEGDTMAGQVVVIATGVHYRRLPVPGAQQLEGISVFYAATLMEAQMCAGDPIAVVGGGNSAGQATIFLSQHVPQLRLVVREDDLEVNMSRYLADRIRRAENVEVLLSTEVREVIGDEALEAVVVEDNRSGERRKLPARALFVFIGATPHTQWLAGRVALDDSGYVLCGPDAVRAAGEDGHLAAGCAPLLLETSLPGVFAAGDVRSGSIKRVATAVGEGSMAIRLVHEYLSGASSSRTARAQPRGSGTG